MKMIVLAAAFLSVCSFGFSSVTEPDSVPANPALTAEPDSVPANLALTAEPDSVPANLVLTAEPDSVPANLVLTAEPDSVPANGTFVAVSVRENVLALERTCEDSVKSVFIRFRVL